MITRSVPVLNQQEKFYDTEGVTEALNMKDRQHNGQKKKDKMTNSGRQNITQNSRLSNTNPT